MYQANKSFISPPLLIWDTLFAVQLLIITDKFVIFSNINIAQPTYRDDV